jgi:hypothetical protein
VIQREGIVVPKAVGHIIVGLVLVGGLGAVWLFLTSLGVDGSLAFWILVGFVVVVGGIGGVAALQPSVEGRLKAATNEWALPLVVRAYDSTDAGRALLQAEAVVLDNHGYGFAGQSAEGSHLHAGRLIATGGLSVLAGKEGTRSDGKLTVTFRKLGQARTSAE